MNAKYTIFRLQQMLERDFVNAGNAIIRGEATLLPFDANKRKAITEKISKKED